MKEETWKIFNSISSTYDRINRILSFGIDIHWRSMLTKHTPIKNYFNILDCATGTGDQLFSILSKHESVQKAVGIDLAAGMLEIAKKKLEKLVDKDKVSFMQASVLALPFADGTYDAVSISFGIRNVANIDLALSEMRRVLNKGGKALILEFSTPRLWLFRKLYLFYLRHILPRLGKLLSKHAFAYSYLNESIETFPSGEEFCKIMRKAGFENVRAYPMTFGIATLYEGYR